MHTETFIYIAKKISILTLPAVIVLCPAKGQLYIAPGSSLVANGAVNIVLNNIGLNNNGGFAPSTGTVIFTGNVSTSSSFIKGSATAFNHLNINKSLNDVQLNTNISVNGNLTFQSGNLQLNNYTVDLGSGAGTLVGENNNSRIIGTTGGLVLKTASLNIPSSVNPGNIGIAITSAANLGLTVITRGHVKQTLSPASFSIDRYFDIAPANNAGLNASITLNYFNGEMDGQNEAGLVFWTSSNGGTNWAQIGKDNLNTVNNFAVKNNLASLYRYTLSSAISFAAMPAAPAAPDENKVAFSFNAIYPNPTRNEVNIIFYSNTNNDCEINLYTQTGQLLEVKKLQAVKGANTFKWNIGKYAAGVYYLAFNGAIFKPARIVKMN